MSNPNGTWTFIGNAKCGTCASMAGEDRPPGSGHENCACSADWEGLQRVV